VTVVLGSAVCKFPYLLTYLIVELFVSVTADVRQQLAEQLRCLDARLDSHVVLLGDLHDFYRRRSELELEYSRSMDKLVRQVAARHKTERLRSVAVVLGRMFLLRWSGEPGCQTFSAPYNCLKPVVSPDVLVVWEGEGRGWNTASPHPVVPLDALDCSFSAYPAL